MKRSFLIVAAALLSSGSAFKTLAQDAAVSTASPAPQSQPAIPAPAPEKPPIGAISAGYLYLGSESAPGVWTWHLHGFYGIPQVNIKPWFGFIGDFVHTANTGVNTHENVEAFLGGPIFTAHAKKKISEFAFATAGKTRDSKNGTVMYSPALAVGGGLTYKLNKHVSLLLVPGEYVRNYAATGPDLNNFTARFGFVLPISR
jgi:hypothetical protein